MTDSFDGPSQVRRAHKSPLSVNDMRGYVRKLIDEYLLGDLERMAELQKSRKGIGFPMLSAAFAGIEFLGRLARPAGSPHGPRCPGRVTTCRCDFERYWCEYLYADDRTLQEAGPLIYDLFRHGVAHSFAPKGATGVALDGDQRGHFRIVDGIVLLDGITFASELRASYQRFRSIIFDGVAGAFSAEHAAAELDVLLTKYEEDAKPPLDGLEPLLAKHASAHPVSSEGDGHVAHADVAQQQDQPRTSSVSREGK